MSRILVFGDSPGVRMVLETLPKEHVIGVVGAAIRPQYHEELRQLAKEIPVPLLIQPRATDETYEQFLIEIAVLKPQLIWVNSYSMKLHEDLLRIPSKGGINIHGALLPEYRGANPTQWAILNYETETGVTLHEMTASIDEGSIIDKRTVKLNFSDTYLDVYNRINLATRELIRENLLSICELDWAAQKQDESNATYRRRRKPEDGCFDWSWPVVDIYNLIRALVQPLPGAFYLNTNNEEIRIMNYQSLMTVINVKNNFTKGFEFHLSEIKMRPLAFDNIPEKKELELDKTLMSFFGLNEALSKENYDQWRENLLSNQVVRVLFSIESILGEEQIGLAQCTNFDWQSRSCEIEAYSFFGSNCSSPELLFQVLEPLIKFSFEELKLKSIKLKVPRKDDENIDLYKVGGFNKISEQKDLIGLELLNRSELKIVTNE